MLQWLLSVKKQKKTFPILGSIIKTICLKTKFSFENSSFNKKFNKLNHCRKPTILQGIRLVCER